MPPLNLLAGWGSPTRTQLAGLAISGDGCAYILFLPETRASWQARR